MTTLLSFLPMLPTQAKVQKMNKKLEEKIKR